MGSSCALGKFKFFSFLGSWEGSYKNCLSGEWEWTLLIEICLCVSFWTSVPCMAPVCTLFSTISRTVLKPLSLPGLSAWCPASIELHEELGSMMSCLVLKTPSHFFSSSHLPRLRTTINRPCYSWTINSTWRLYFSSQNIWLLMFSSFGVTQRKRDVYFGFFKPSNFTCSWPFACVYRHFPHNQ